MALKSVPVGLFTRGARRVRAHLEKLSITVPAFCEQNGLLRHQVERVLNGRTTIVSVDLAVAMCNAISRVTAGPDGDGPVVLPSDFASSTARMTGEKRARKQPARAASYVRRASGAAR